MHLLHDVFWTGPPPFGLDYDHGGWIIVGLYQELRVERCSEVLICGLCILSAGYHNSLGPATGPLSADEGDPVALAVVGSAEGDFGVELDAHAEVEFEGWGWEGEGAGDVAFVETVEEVVGGDAIFHHIEVGAALEEMLSLAGCVFGPDLVAVYALDGEAFVRLVGSEVWEGQSDVMAVGRGGLISTNALWTSSRGGAGMLDPGVCLGVCFGLLTIGLGAGVVLEPVPLTGGRDGLFCSGVPFKTAVAPSRAFAAPLIENAGP